MSIKILSIEPVYTERGHIEAVKIKAKNEADRDMIIGLTVEISGRTKVAPLGKGDIKNLILKAGEEKVCDITISPAPRLEDVFIIQISGLFIYK